MLGTKSILNFTFWEILEYLHYIHTHMYKTGWASQTHNWKIQNAPVSIFFEHHESVQKVLDLEAFWISDFQICESQPVWKETFNCRKRSIAGKVTVILIWTRPPFSLKKCFENLIFFHNEVSWLLTKMLTKQTHTT